MKLRLASSIETDSIVDGEGLRTVVWMQGCAHNCEGCHNPETHDINAGEEVELESVLEVLSEVENQSGITLTGGDPMFQPKPTLLIAAHAKSIGMNVWCYTGYTYEKLLEMSKSKPIYMEILKNVDVLVDGKFELAHKSLNCIYRGSTNQRIIDVPASLSSKQIVLKKEYYENTTENMLPNREYVFI